MKSRLFTILLALAGLFSPRAFGLEPMRFSDVNSLVHITRDDTIPWPWGKELPFPWTFAQGVWLVEYKDFSTYFSFRVVRSAGGLNQLEVTQIDPTTCEQTSAGVGVEQDRLVRAQMQSRYGHTYRILLRSFDEKQVAASQVEVGAKPVNGQYMVMTIIPFDTQATVTVPMQLISNRLGFKCRVQQ